MTNIPAQNTQRKRGRPFEPGNSGKPKGTLSKTTKIAKEVIAEAADRLGGVDRLVVWAQLDPQNERAFWAQIYPRLLPLQLTGEGGGPVQVAAVEWTVVRPEDQTASR